jgi:hypothetical protein
VGLISYATELWNRIERITGAHPTIDTNHAQVHGKNGFSIVAAMAVLAGNTGGVQINVPAGVYVHLQAIGFEADNGPGGVFFAEDVSMTAPQFAAATAVTPVNHHRIDPPASALTIKANTIITVTNGAAPVTMDRLPVLAASVGVNKTNDKGNGNPNEWVLCPGKTYLIYLANNDDVTINFTFRVFWYEEASA